MLNDTLGHLEGDTLLQSVARELESCFRVDDIVGRLGGDEFIALMYGVSTREIIERKAEELCARIRSIRMAHPRYSGVSVSIGVACPGHGDSFEELYAKADVALYHAKQGGRDRFCHIRRGIRPGFRKEGGHGAVDRSAVSMENRLSDGCRRPRAGGPNDLYCRETGC